MRDLIVWLGGRFLLGFVTGVICWSLVLMAMWLWHDEED